LSGWLIVKSSAVPPLSGTADSAYRVKVACGDAARDVVIEFTAPSALTSVGYAEEVTRPFLANPEPPQHLIVEVSGAVRVLKGPDEDQPAAVPGPPEPGRARPRRRS
jgi:hypothetical protein